MISFKRLNNIIEKGKYISEDPKLTNEKLKLLNELLEHFESYQWLSHPNTKEKVKTFTLTNFSYSKTAKIFKTSKNSIYVTISNASKYFEKSIGVNTIDLILEDRIDEARTQFNFASRLTNTSQFLIKGINEILPRGKDHGLDLLDCLYEIRLIKSASIKRLESKINEYDKSKLAQVKYILDTDSKEDLPMQMIIWKFLFDEISLENLANSINDLKGKNMFIIRAENKTEGV